MNTAPVFEPISSGLNFEPYDVPPCPTDPLIAVGDEWQARAQTLNDLGFNREAHIISAITVAYIKAAAPFMWWISESDAQVRSGHTTAWLRSHFPLWESAGHARKIGHTRQYRSIIIPISGASVAGSIAGTAAA